MTESTNWNPIWNDYLLSAIILLSVILCFIPTLYFSIQINKKIKTPELKKRWKYFNLGLIGAHATIYSGIMAFSTNNYAIINIWAIYSLSSVIWAYFIYYGIGRNLD